MRRHKSAAMIFRGAAIFAFGIACGPTSVQTATARSALSACDALSKAEVGDVLGTPVSDGRALVSKDDVTVCSFASQGDSRMLVLLRRSAGRDWTESQAQRMKNAWSFRPAPGLGDQAFMFGTRESGAVLCVFYRDFYLQISVFRAGNLAHAYELTERLCRRVLKRLEATPDVNRDRPRSLGAVVGTVQRRDDLNWLQSAHRAGLTYGSRFGSQTTAFN